MTCSSPSCPCDAVATVTTGPRKPVCAHHAHDAEWRGLTVEWSGRVALTPPPPPPAPILPPKPKRAPKPPPKARAILPPPTVIHPDDPAVCRCCDRAPSGRHRGLCAACYTRAKRWRVLDEVRGPKVSGTPEWCERVGVARRGKGRKVAP